MHKLARYIYSLVLILAVASCSSSRDNLTYFSDLNNSISGTLPTNYNTVTIEPEAELVIIVKSEVPSASADFNLSYVNPSSPGMRDSNVQSQLQVYKVDKEGNIDFPKLGKIHVAGMTIYQLKEYLIEKIGHYVKDPIVTVEMSGYRVVVMGEVANPKTIVTKAEHFSVLDALAVAGDLTEYGLRDNILVLRRHQDDKIEYYRLNLNDSQVVQSPAFWLKNNDIVLVSPNKVKQDNAKYNQNNAYKLSVVSTIVGMSSAIISLIIALAIN